jgi:hypothetical protein
VLSQVIGCVAAWALRPQPVMHFMSGGMRATYGMPIAVCQQASRYGSTAELVVQNGVTVVTSNHSPTLK